MLYNSVKNFFQLPSSTFLNNTTPPVNTPDLCLLERKPFHLVFDFANYVKNPCFSNNAFTTQRFFMWLQNHEEGTPPLVFEDQVTKRMCPRARLRGKLHRVSIEELMELDTLHQNTLSSTRRAIRVILPDIPLEMPVLGTRNMGLQTYGRPSWVDNVWVYTHSPKHWSPIFSFDFSMWRGRKDSGFLPAKTIKDERPFVRDYFTPTQSPAHKPKALFVSMNMRNLKRSIDFEEKAYVEECHQDSLVERLAQAVSPTVKTPPQIT